MNIFEIKTFDGGISQYEDKGIRGAFKFGSGLDIRRKIDSIKANQAYVDEGLDSSASPSSSPSASPSPSPTASASPSYSGSPSPSSSTSPSPSPSSGLSTVFDDLILFFVEAKDGYTYGFGDSGSVYRRDADGFWMRVYKDPNGKITGASEWYSNSKKTYLYFASKRKLMRKQLFRNENWNDVEEVGTLEEADYHTMVQAGGALTIANKEFIAYVGYDESFTPEATDIIPGNFIKTMVERDGRAIMGTYREAYPLRGVNGAIDCEVPLAQVGDEGEVFYANMIDQTPVFKFPGGGKVNPGGVANMIKSVNFFEWEEGASSWIDKQSVGNLSLWGVYGADSGFNGVYSYGRKSKNKPLTLNLEVAMDVDEIGAVINVNGTTIVSYKDGTDYGVLAESATTKATGVYEGLDFKAPVEKPEMITNWKMTELYFDPLPSGTSVEFWYRVNKNGSFVQATTQDGSSQWSVANSQKAVFLLGVDGDIFEPKVITNPTGNNTPEVHRIRTYFE